MQSIVVWIIVALAAIYVGRRFTRTLSGKGKQGCDCGASCDACSSPKDRLCDFPTSKDSQEER